ncbi:MAG: Glu/Leu/Phe/Val dehydrogenase dimerization domain-containing protein [Alphaproteobacteria bacterium]|nr:Glu/Leu/Phe/Val dehydrogenase dimerization domain-containing protein [Alphaproteobacteria bacterium]
MTVFAARDFDDHEQVVFCSDRSNKLLAIIAIHNTNRGPSLGGCRMWPYATEQEAIDDALRLSRGMTYKSALAGLPYGGGKSVVIGNPRLDKTKELFESLGENVERLSGRYIIAEDVGTNVDDMETMLTKTRHVVGTRTGGSDNPSPFTALGVFVGIKAAVKHKMRVNNLDGIKIAVQGLGSVGYKLCELLHKEGAHLIVSDIDTELNEKAKKEFNAKISSLDEILAEECDVLAPCALGAIVNDDTIDNIKAKIIAGAANNQLAQNRHGLALAQRNILYTPDYVLNAGGLINVSYEQHGYNKAKAEAHVLTIYDTLLEIFQQADAEKLPTNVAADRIAENRFQKTAPKKNKIAV